MFMFSNDHSKILFSTQQSSFWDTTTQTSCKLLYVNFAGKLCTQVYVWLVGLEEMEYTTEL